MKRVNVLLIVLFFVLACVPAISAGNGKLSGYTFGDFYYIAQDHNADFEGRNGFWLRRIYFTYDQKLSDSFSTRVRLEMSQPDGLNKAADKAFAVVKDAYIKWKTGKHQVYLGISSTPTWSVVEKTWGYRSVEKTPLDLYKFGSSRDFGVALKGNLDNAGKFKYHLMVGNGNSNKSENDKGKMAMLSLGYHPSKSFFIEVYGDIKGKADNGDWTTFQVFSAYKTDNFRLGVQYAHQKRNDADITLDAASVFSVMKLSNKSSLFARVDFMMDPNPLGNKISYIPFDTSVKSTLVLAGIDFKVHKKFSIMPNLEVVIYDKTAGGEKIKNDVIPRITFYYKF